MTLRMPEQPDMPLPPTVLVLGKGEAVPACTHALENSGVETCLAADCTVALRATRDQGASVVLCDESSAPGAWRVCLNELQRMPVPPNVIVLTPRLDGAMLAEVLMRGGYDVLQTPVSPDALTRSVMMAHLRWLRERTRTEALQLLSEAVDGSGTLS
jgi:DNA-binding NtrC family response regulator